MTTATLRTTIEDSVSAHDVRKTLRLMTRYAWIGTGILFICYSYFVGAITFSVIKQEALDQNSKGLISTMSTQESTYLQTEQNLTAQDSAAAMGLVPSTAIAFATATPVLALNVGQ